MKIATGMPQLLLHNPRAWRASCVAGESTEGSSELPVSP